MKKLHMFVASRGGTLVTLIASCRLLNDFLATKGMILKDKWVAMVLQNIRSQSEIGTKEGNYGH